MLDGVSGFVGGYAEGGEAGAAVVLPTQSEALIVRVVVIGQRAVALDDFDVVNAGAFHHGLCGLASRNASARWYFDVFAVGALDFHLGPEADDNRDENVDKEWRVHRFYEFVSLLGWQRAIQVPLFRLLAVRFDVDRDFYLVAHDGLGAVDAPFGAVQRGAGFPAGEVSALHAFAEAE